MKTRKCIYCDSEKDLSESDVIPDALTNARVTNRCVCRIEHNNKFSDLFESQVIEALSFIANELDIKSSKGSDYAVYPAIVKINGIDYDIKMKSGTDLFNGRVLKSTDGKYLLSSFEKTCQIAKNSSKVESIDINKIEIEKKVNVSLEIYFSLQIYRLVAKIAFEWYCAKNDVSGFHDDFSNIIEFIITGKGNNPVGIIQNRDIYDFMSNQLNLGSHCLIAFQDCQNKISVIVNLFGIAMYRVVVCDYTPEFCNNNLLYQELCTDSSRKEVVSNSIETLDQEYVRFLSSTEHFSPVKLDNGITYMISTQVPKIDIQLYTFIYEIVRVFRGVHNEATIPNKEMVDILIRNINQTLQASLLHKKSLKRFVKERFRDGKEPLKINPDASNKKEIFLLYTLYVIGKNRIEEIDDKILQQIIRTAFNMGTDREIYIDNELISKLKSEMLLDTDYLDIIQNAANVIQRWE